VFRDVYRGAVYFLHTTGFRGMRVVSNFVGICKKSGTSRRRLSRNVGKVQQHYVYISYTELHEHWTVNGKGTCRYYVGTLVYISRTKIVVILCTEFYVNGSKE